MLAAECIPGSAVTVRAADDFYRYIDGWRGVIADMTPQAGGVWVECKSPADEQPLHFLVPPEQLEKDEKTTES